VIEDIDFALVEEIRPPLYTAMKYWGKKPHNIWHEYIRTYTPENGTYLDPFAGSAVSAFEAVKAGRKVCAFDLNPLTTFLIETFCAEFDSRAFAAEAKRIIEDVGSDEIYQSFFSTTCRQCGSSKTIAQHFKWEARKIYEVGIECTSCRKDAATRHLAEPSTDDHRKAQEMSNIVLTKWVPDDQFHDSPSFTASFKEGIGGNHFKDIWTKRNLYVLSEIFSRISKVKDENLKRHLLLGFIKSLHLCSKMCVPRRGAAARPFSTSWGRSAYICADRQMEMNPLLLFEGSCFGKQSVQSSISDFASYIGRIPKILYVDRGNRSINTKNFDIKYGIVDVSSIEEFVEPESIDFIMTDPPYGGLVQYLDLSALWLIWLKKIDPRFAPDFASEITIKKGILDLEAYKSRFLGAVRGLHTVLKPEGKVVFTFHNKDIKIWNAFLNSIALGGFKIEKVIHQQNRRAGESNVANPYGTSATDFYIRCVKKPNANIRTTRGEFEHFVVETASRIIALRNEPTPYLILFNGLLAELSSAGFDLENFDRNVETILKGKVGSIFCILENQENSGARFWFTNPAEHIKYPDKKLTDRVEETVVALLRRRGSASFDEVLGEIFVKYPNGLTPDIRSVDDVLQRFATQSAGKWVYKGGDLEKDFTDHTEMLYHLIKLGKRLTFEIFVGKREQPEVYDGRKLSDFADHKNLRMLDLDKEVQKRVEMIDMLWIKNGLIRMVIEVENSTNFTSGVQRASNLAPDIPKLMILPDHRGNEFLGLNDPLFVDNFQKYSWKYLYYSDVTALRNEVGAVGKKLEEYAKER
jgi:hypothetical protein